MAKTLPVELLIFFAFLNGEVGCKTIIYLYSILILLIKCFIAGSSLELLFDIFRGLLIEYAPYFFANLVHEIQQFALFIFPHLSHLQIYISKFHYIFTYRYISIYTNI